MQTAGTPFSVSLTAKDAYGNTTTGYTGNGKCIVFSGPANSPDGHVPVYPAQGSCAAGQSSVNFTNGVSNPNPSITLYRATPSTLYPGTQTTITATDAPSSKSGSTGAFNVNGTGVRSRFLILPDTTTPVAGAADNLTIVLGDPYGNPTNYNVSPNLTFAGANNAPNGTQPTVTNSGGTARNFTQTIQIAFVNGVSHVNGTANGLMRLYRVETANITVRLSTGTPNYVSNALAFNVQPAAITTFTVTNPAAQTAGTSFNLSITATDTYGNANTGTRCLTFSGPANAPDGTPPSYPAQGSCAAGQSEVTFTAAPTLVPVTLYRAAATTLTITDVQSGFTRTTASFTVDPAAIDHFSMTAATTTPTAGATDNLSITAIDPYGNTASGYTGSHDLTFSGAGSIRTYDPTVTNSGGTATDFGTATAITFTNGVSSAGGVMRLYRAQTAHIVVSDGSHDNGSGLQVTVSPAAFDNLALSAEKAVVRPGATDQLTIRAVDLYGNTAPGYTDGAHNIYFAGGTGTRTVTNTSGSQIAFGSATSLVFANGVSTTGGVMRINDAQTANITAGDGVHTSPAYRIVVSGVSASVVSAGGFHTCALVAGGVQCWGYNNYGQLGNNSTTNSSTPVRVVGVGGTGYLSNVTQISAGKYHTCAVVSGGAVYCWGQNASGPNVYGQLGNNSTTNSSTPVQVLTDAVTYLTNVTQVGSGGGHTCALRSDNTVYCWGRNAFGEVGDNTTTRRLVAVQVRISAGAFLTNAVQIAIGANHSCAQLSDSTVRCWGYNFYGEIGDNTTTNSSVATQVLAAGGSGSLTGVSAISSGRFHTCALLSDHSVYCWGDNDNGELGDGTTTSRSLPVRAGTIDNATSISAGEYHSCSVLDDGTAQCWGAAAFGQVGDGTTADTSTPVPVVGPGGWGLLTNIAAISAGGGNWPDGTGTDNYEHTVALLTDGTVVSWGQNIYGELGDGTTTMSIFPTGVALL
jgi:alpha-tubulin suppressor-like RCC1 family protein